MKQLVATKVHKGPHHALRYENPEIVGRIARESNLTLLEAQKIFTNTLRFLVLCGTWKGALAPTASIDIGWHTFLLFTREYREYCQAEFGRFIDHVPTPKLIRPNGRSLKRRVTNTLAGAKALFEQEVTTAWGTEFGPIADSADCSPSTNCQSSCCHDGNPG